MRTMVSALWLLLLRAQQPMQYADIVAATPDLKHGQRGSVLKMAYRLGYVERTGELRKYAYAVTPRCAVPPTITVAEILEATS